MASSTFFKLATGAVFTLPGYPAKEDGTSVQYTKLDAVRAQDEFGRIWSFSPSLAIGAQGTEGQSPAVPTSPSTTTTAVSTTPGPVGPAGPAGVNGANGANGVNADMTRTSSTSQTIGAGSLTFTFDTPSPNLGWMVGSLVQAASRANTANWMQGLVTAVNSTTVTVLMAATNGAGTFSDWNLFISGVQGPTGATGATGPAGAAGPGVAAGGTAGQQLEKIDATNYNTQWVTRGHVPAGGTAAQVLSKIDGTDYNTQWVAASGGADVLQVQVFS